MELGTFVAEVFASGRFAILKRLLAGRARYTDLAKELALSEGELSRHLARLTAAGLTVKHADGSYTPTPLAVAALAQAPGLQFLADRATFVAKHAFHELPVRLLGRLDDLAQAQVLDNPFQIYGAFEKVVQGIDKRFWALWIIGQTVFEQAEIDVQRKLGELIAAKRPDVRIVALEHEVPLYHDLVAPIEDLVHARMIAGAPASIALSDEAALVHFNDLDGRVDLGVGFYGTDPRFLDFVAAMVEDAWTRAAPTTLVRTRAAPVANPKRGTAPLRDGA